MHELDDYILFCDVNWRKFIERRNKLAHCCERSEMIKKNERQNPTKHKKMGEEEDRAQEKYRNMKIMYGMQWHAARFCLSVFIDVISFCKCKQIKHSTSLANRHKYPFVLILVDTANYERRQTSCMLQCIYDFIAYFASRVKHYGKVIRGDQQGTICAALCFYGQFLWCRVWKCLSVPDAKCVEM